MEQTRKVLTEFSSILGLVPSIDIVTIEEPTTLPQSTAGVLVDVGLDSTIYELTKPTAGIDGYLKHFFVSLQVNVDCTSDSLLVYDIADTIEEAITKDSELWLTVIDRDLKSIVYDNGSLKPYRSFTMLLEVKARMDCA